MLEVNQRVKSGEGELCSLWHICSEVVAPLPGERVKWPAQQQ